MPADPKKIVQRFETLRSSRQTGWEETWQQISDHLLGRRDFQTEYVQPGRQRLDNIYDGSGMQAARMLASAVASLLTNAATKWFHLLPSDKRLLEMREVQVWLEQAEEQLYFAFNRPEAGFQPHIHETYVDLINFGTGGLGIFDGPDGAYFVSRNLQELYLAEDHRGRIDTVFRHFRMTTRQVMQEYELVGETKERFERMLQKSDQAETPHKIIHGIFPNTERIVGRVGREGMPWASVHVLVDEGKPKILREGGFHEKPILTPRWEKDAGEIYGRGPGVQALPDQRMANEMNKTMLKAGQKAVDPPLFVTDRGVHSNIRTHAGGVTTYRPDGSGQPPVHVLESRTRMDIGQALLADRRQMIENAYYADVLNVFRNPHMTATQVIELSQLTQRLLSPVLGRQQNELLEPMVDRVFGIELRANRLPPVPEILVGQTINVEYQSPVARAQRFSDRQVLFETLTAFVNLAPIDPTVMDNFNLDRLAERTWELGGLPADILRTPQERAVVREQRARVAAENRQMEAIQESADVASKVVPLFGEAAA